MLGSEILRPIEGIGRLSFRTVSLRTMYALFFVSLSWFLVVAEPSQLTTKGLYMDTLLYHHGLPLDVASGGVSPQGWLAS